MNPQSRQFTEQAMANHQSGDLQRAEALYLQALSADKTNSDAEQFLGLLYLQSGRASDGITRIRRAIAINANVAPYHDNLGAALESIGDADGALHSFQKAGQLDHEKNPDRSFGIGNAFVSLGKTKEAKAAFNEAIALNPQDSAFHFNLGNLLKSEENFAGACDSYRKAAACPQPVKGALNNLGTTLRQLARHRQAIEVFEQSLAADPQNITTLINIADALVGSGELDKAATRLQQARKLPAANVADNAARVHQLSGTVALGKAQYANAINAFRQTLAIQADNADAKSGLAAVFRWINPEAYDSALVADLRMLLNDPKIVHQRFSRLISNQLRLGFKAVLPEEPNSPMLTTGLREVARETLLIKFLSQLTNTDAVFEQTLKQIRHGLLQHYASALQPDADLVALASALAIQAFLNEHVWTVADEENQLLLSLDFASVVSQGLKPGALPDRPIDWLLAIAAMYIPLNTIADVTQTSVSRQGSLPPLLDTLIRKAVLEPAEELSLRDQIPVLKTISDTTSGAVKAQYETHPYPRWFQLPPAGRSSYRDYLQSQFPHQQFDSSLSEPLEVLVAGCGTGQETAMIARSRVVKEVIGLDLSLTSLAYAERMCRVLELATVRFLHGDILDAGLIGQQFPVIESTGVLHHMQDPLKGWRTLTECLMPGGMMKVGLYSTRASVEVNAARRWIGEQGFGSDSQTICQVRQQILTLPQSDSLYPLRYSEDFYSVSACRDLIFHVQEQCYTPAQLAQMLDMLNLEFVGFELPDRQIKLSYMALFPQDSQMTNLKNWEKFDQQQPQTFAGMLVFWCRKKAAFSAKS